ncbi:MAG: methyltransferase domain-containing protein [Actinobacteria bacterium]|nr:methyltransferase domain-containing protein [Actinomycetota bacterium]
MLTVDYRRLGLRAGDRVLDMGAGGGRHAFESLRRGGVVVALDIDRTELKDVAAMIEAMSAAGEAPAGARGAAVSGSGLALPFPDAAFDRVVASEVLEHVEDDRRAICELARVLRPGGVLAVTVPRWLPELVNWALDDDYHAPAVPGGHVRIYRESVLRDRLRAAGLRVVGRHHAHGLHTPYWWLRCAVGIGNDQHRLARAYHQVLVWDLLRQPWPLQVAERVLQPLIGKSLVLYAVRDGRK